MQIEIYTDGACSGNPGPGGWAAIIINNGKEIDLSGGEKLTTNNKMELTAFIESIKYIQSTFADQINEVHLTIYSDSKYVIDGIQSWLPNWKKRGWKTADKKPVKNIEFWTEIDELIQGLNFKLIWVKGHANNEYNERADQLAVKAIPL
jgi:ribonuclease HI